MFWRQVRRRCLRGREGDREERRLPQEVLQLQALRQGHGLAPSLGGPGW